MNTLFTLPVAKSDVVYTPDDVAFNIIRYLNPYGSCLDPCAGDGAFYRNLPNADYCELSEGKDFFDYHKRVVTM